MIVYGKIYPKNQKNEKEIIYVRQQKVGRQIILYRVISFVRFERKRVNRKHLYLIISIVIMSSHHIKFLYRKI